MTYQILGTCSLCGGRVSIRCIGLTFSPTPTCESCGAVAAMHGPVIPMVPRPVFVPAPVRPDYATPIYRWWEVTCGPATNQPALADAALAVNACLGEPS